ncbi:arginine--tRNA ligase [Candidatus Saccharibacteria bacterium]|nr:arginine--tRNA ligase [Candidatus Saccharibacteria bacterium]
MEEIRECLKTEIAKLFDVEILPEVTVAPEGQGADYATNVAMRLSGMLKAKGEGVSPREIAETIAKEVEASELGFSVEVAGPGFLNFIARDEYWKTKLAEMEADFEKNISCDEYSGKTVICEFSDPNPFKVLHVGHLYTSIVGDAISRLIEFAGGKVIRANFGGDVGLHVAKTLYALTAERSAESALTIEDIAKAYVKGTQLYEDDEAAKAEIVKLNKKIYEIAENNLHDSELAELYWRGREISYQYFEDFYKRVGVKFDKYYPESTVALRGLSEVKAQVGNVYEESNGAVVFPGEKYGLHTRVFVNAEGLPTYEAKDVGLLFTKWDDYHFDKSIVITGNDIIDYMKVVLKSVSLYAPELVERTKHITHGNVRLPGNEKMSSRKGNFIKAVEVLDDVEALVGRSIIAMGAIKYAFLKYKIGGNIEFDAKESVSTTGNSGVYLQYSAVRAKKILAGIKAGEADFSEWELDGNEKKLIAKLAQYGQILKDALSDFAPHKIANYLYETAQEFSRFYENVKVAGSEYESERAALVDAYYKTMEHGLGILGIEIPEEM